ncbi:MAG: ABC transporter ATP-binding protein [Pirellulaceae bacterium]|jgi:lipoprotein-releasing system ATP-binding protein|nr:ABC transporter ATP-binding protein [Pirellulaceae bacterium]HJN11361.1 ABC transporter ATP-binding protein [Pirellulaceae bacterium]
MNSFLELATKRLGSPHRTSGPHTTFPSGPTSEQANTEPDSGTVSTLNQPAVDGTESPSQEGPLMAARGLSKSYWKGKHEISVLHDVDFEVQRNEFVSIIGQSGSGKSTLLHVLGTLDALDAGEIHFDGNRIDVLSTSQRDKLRNQQFGMVFQFYHLLPEVTTLENVLMPIMIAEGVFGYWRRKREYVERAKNLLEMVGLSHRLEHRPRELSGGEMQRAAIARSLIAQPRLLLADEPTGNLDRKNGEEVMQILRTLNVEQNLTIVMVTHDAGIAAQADRTVRLFEGRVQLA